MAPNRRDVLGKVSGTASGIALLGTVSIASASDDAGKDRKATSLKGKERQEAVRRFIADSRVQALLKKAHKLGWHPNLSQAKVTKSVGEDIERVAITTSFKKRGSGKSRSNMSEDKNRNGPRENSSYPFEQTIFLSWESSGTLDPVLFHYEEKSDDNRSKSPQTTSNIHQTKYMIGNSGQVVQDVADVSDVMLDPSTISGENLRSKRENELSIQSDDCYTKCKSRHCEQWHLECVAQLIFSGVIALGSCAGCASFDLSKSSCLVCIGSLGLTGTSPFTCSIGENCSMEYECVSTHEYNYAWNSINCKDPENV